MPNKFFVALILILASIFSFGLNAQNLLSNSSFTEYGVWYRLPTYLGTDTKSKKLGNVSLTIKPTSNGFVLIGIDGAPLKKDNIFPDYQNNQNGQVNLTDMMDSYMFEAHYRKNGISYIVFFNSDRVRKYFISH